MCIYVALSYIELFSGLTKNLGVEPRVVEGEVRGEVALEVKGQEEDLQDGEKILKDWEDVKEETDSGELELKINEKDSDEKDQEEEELMTTVETSE